LNWSAQPSSPTSATTRTPPRWLLRPSATWHAGRREEGEERLQRSLRDRYAMIRSSTAPRHAGVRPLPRLRADVLRRQLRRRQPAPHLLCVALAAHEIDAVESVYFDDKLI
jgi:hypothetical protein